MRYSPERKEAVLKKMMPPHNRSISQLTIEEGISEATLYNWRQEARSKGILMPDGDAGLEGWNARDKFAAVGSTRVDMRHAIGGLDINGVMGHFPQIEHGFIGRQVLGTIIRRGKNGKSLLHMVADLELFLPVINIAENN